MDEIVLSVTAGLNALFFVAGFHCLRRARDHARDANWCRSEACRSQAAAYLFAQQARADAVKAAEAANLPDVLPFPPQPWLDPDLAEETE